MKPLSLPHRLHLTHFSKPQADRSIYRLALKHQPHSIVELGLGMALRTTRLLTLAQSYAQREDLSYAGIDLFEMRPASAPGTTLKRSHKLLSPLAGKVRLMPGDPYRTLMQLANTLGPVDLILISADQDPLALTQAWFYVPRMLHENTQVLLEQPTGKPQATKFVEVPHQQIKRLAHQAAPRRRAA